MARPDRYYDDLKQVGIDFADAREVAAYDERQGDSREDAALLRKLGLKASDTLADIMEGLITQAGFDLQSTEYSGGIYADYLARMPQVQ